jgi:hypothetical protein
MLESGGVLRTWALERLPHVWQAAHTRTIAGNPNCPTLSAESTVVAMRLGDHRLAYLEKEGPLSGDRGTVVRVAAGTYHSEHESPQDWRVMFTSDDVSPIARLTHSATDSARWTLTCS